VGEWAKKIFTVLVSANDRRVMEKLATNCFVRAWFLVAEVTTGFDMSLSVMILLMLLLSPFQVKRFSTDVTNVAISTRILQCTPKFQVNCCSKKKGKT
jgi:biotin carboxylase